MLYKLKIYHYCWWYIKDKARLRLSKEHVLEAINNLGLKSVRSVKKNKKPYIMVKLTSKEEYIKLKGQMKRFQL